MHISSKISQMRSLTARKLLLASHGQQHLELKVRTHTEAFLDCTSELHHIGLWYGSMDDNILYPAERSICDLQVEDLPTDVRHDRIR